MKTFLFFVFAYGLGFASNEGWRLWQSSEVGRYRRMMGSDGTLIGVADVGDRPQPRRGIDGERIGSRWGRR